jgi:hypothetical protein
MELEEGVFGGLVARSEEELVNAAVRMYTDEAVHAEVRENSLSCVV